MAPTGSRSLTKRQGDDDFKGMKEQEVLFYSVPTHLAQRQEPWQQLNGRYTLCSARHHTYHFDPSVPSDDLDFVIKSNYNHEKDLFKTKKDVVHQLQLCEDKHRDVYHNRIKSQPEKKMQLNHPLLITHQTRKEDANSMKTNISSIHIHATRHGYTCKPQTGGFFL